MNIDAGDRTIADKIFTIRGVQVMIDSDLASLYGVETKVFNQAVKRNLERFPIAFRFQLTQEEHEALRSRYVTLERGRGRHKKYLPYVFTEQGVSMLSAVLRSKIAIEMSIQIINSFVEMRKFVSQNAVLFQRLEALEQKQRSSDKRLEMVLDAIEERTLRPRQGIFFDGQVFDAYLFVADLIKSATSSLVLIDNYVDESVLILLTKRAVDCDVTIYTKTISRQLQLDLKKHNEQYAPVEIKVLKDAHDRFLIIDDQEVYHIGASLKDLGKRWFAFSKFDKEALRLLERLEKSKP